MASSAFSTTPVDFSKSYDLSELKDSTALVTGGASGLGYGLVEALAKAGAFVAIADVSKQGESIAQGLRDQGHNVIFVFTDTTSYDSQLNAFKATIAHSPKNTIDLVVPAAGVVGSSAIEDALQRNLPKGADPPPPPTLCLNINLMGVYYSMYLALHYFAKTAPNTNANKQLLFISSIAGYCEMPKGAQYSGSKFAIRGMWKAIRHLTVESFGVRTNLIAPSFVRTPMTAKLEEAFAAKGITMASVEDFTDASLRAVCDKSINARAIAIAPVQDGGKPGTGNFDLNDDIEGGDAGLEMKKALTKKGALTFTADELASTAAH